MKLNELIDKTEDFLKAKNRERKEKKKYLKKVLKKLREHEEELEEKFKSGYGNTEKLSNELALIHAQRKKGLTYLRQLHDESRMEKLKKKKDKQHLDDGQS